MTRSPENGFTLIEAIIAMVITGIVAGIVAVFMAAPINSYLDSSRRAGMTDVADTALRRIGYELRTSVPNSLVVSGGGTVLTFIPAKDGGRYRLYGPGDILDGTVAGDTAFDVLGPAVSGVAGDFLVVFNTGQVGLDAYVGSNRRTLSAPAATTVTFANATNYPPQDSPFQRFQIVPATGPVEYACNLGAGTITRRTNYFAGFSGGLAQSALMANDVSACQFEYLPLNALNGLLTLRLSITREGETITLLHQVHVDNTP